MSVFTSLIHAGFECSTQKLRDGRRLDLVNSTMHDRLVRADYLRLQELGIRTVREGARWHLIESCAGKYTFDSLDSIFDAADETGTQVVLDLLHFGYPEHIALDSPDFVESFRRFAVAIARHLKRRGYTRPFVAPVNEISFFSWAAGDVAYLNPFLTGCGDEIKRQLTHAAIVASEAILRELPEARLVAPEPVIHIGGNPAMAGEKEEVERHRQSQFDAWDVLCGRRWPELGGDPRFLDIIGINYYCRNQWIHNSQTLDRDDPRYRPFHLILNEVWERYGRPLYISETGTEDEDRPEWFSFICAEVKTAIDMGVPVQGICLYPILNHPGWDDDRHCQNGLFGYADESGNRAIYAPLENAIRRQQQSFQFLARDSNLKLEHSDLLCFSHLRWGFVFQRPQHLMSRFARRRRVYFIEEPIFEGNSPTLRQNVCPQTGVRVITPLLPPGTANPEASVRRLLAAFLPDNKIESYVAWFYTPMALPLAAGLQPEAIIYDCMDELSLFDGAHPDLHLNERLLFSDADLVFTGGTSLFEAKRLLNPSVHAFPSSVDIEHFIQARSAMAEPADQVQIPHPRIGYAGVIDERMDLDLLRQAAAARPEWHFVMIGPVVKISPDILPRAENIHYLGMKAYQDLPAYFSGWDVAMLPFARNNSTKFISPTKTLEYLAAGLPAVSTPISDVVRPYGELGLVSIAANPAEFVEQTERLLSGKTAEWRRQADAFVNTMSWDKTWSAMNKLIQDVVARKAVPLTAAAQVKTVEEGFARV